MPSYDERCLLLERQESNLPEYKAPQPYDPPKEFFCASKLAGVLLVSTGVFISGIDQSFITATYVDIASSMKSLNYASLLLTAYNLGYCIALPLYGKISDRYGRKIPLIGSNFIFGTGCLLSGMSFHFWQIILGRAVTGIGAAGMVSLVSVIITDSVPPSQVASMRSYVTVVSVLGRCSGGIIGAFILEIFGWQWSFVLQAPLVLIAGFASYTLMPESIKEKSQDNGPFTVKDFDILGITFFVLAISSYLKATSQQIPEVGIQQELNLPVAALLACIFGFSFLAIELSYVRVPFLPLNRLSGTMNAYLVAQIIIFFAYETHMANLPSYFVYAEKFKTTTTAIYLITSSVGFSIGSIIGGSIIKWSHRVKIQSIIGLATSIIIYLLIALQWEQGAHTLEAIYTFLSGFTLGALLAASFGALAATCSRHMIASTITSYYLCQEVGSILGTGFSTSALQGIFRALLQRELPESIEKSQIISGVSRDINYFKTLPIPLQQQIQNLFLQSFYKIAMMATGVACLALPILVVTPEQVME